MAASWALLSGLPSLPGLPFGEDEVERSTPVLLQSRAVARARSARPAGGVLADSPTSERRVAALAEDRLDEAAAESDLLRRAVDSTRAMPTGMATSLGYDQVEVRFATTGPSAQ